MMGKRVIGLDIGSHSIKVVEVLSRHGVPHLRKFGMVPVSEEILSDGRVAEPKEAAKLIGAALKQGRIRPGRVYTALSGHGTVLRRVSLPLMPVEEMNEALRWELDGQIPYSLSEVNIRHYSRLVDDENRADVVAVCALEDNIRSLIAALELARLHPAGIDITPFCLTRAYLQSRHAGSPPPSSAVDEGFEVENIQRSAVMLVDIGHSQTTITIVEGDMPIFTRTLGIGGAQIAAAGGHRDDLGAVDGIEALLTEIRRSHDYFRLQNQWEQHVGKVILAGGGVFLREFRLSLAEEMDIEVEVLNPVAGFTVSPRLNVLELQGKAPLFGVALGLTIGGDENGKG